MFRRIHRLDTVGFPPEVEAREAVADVHHDVLARHRSFVPSTPHYVDQESQLDDVDEMCQRCDIDLFAVLKAWTK